MSDAIRAGFACPHRYQANRYGHCRLCTERKPMEPTTDTTTKPEGWNEATAASAEADMGPERIGSAELELACRLSDDELLAKGQALADELAKVDAIKAEAKAAAEVFSDRRKGHEATASELAAIVRAKAEKRVVPCTIVRILALGVVRTVRDDTGEIVSERPLEAHERQASLFSDDDEAGDVEEGDLDVPPVDMGKPEEYLDDSTAISDPDAVLGDPSAKKRGRR